MKTTRDDDLDILTTHANAGKTDSVHVRSVREQVYEQSKDLYLESKRKELERWIVSGLEAYSGSNGVPSLKDRENMAVAEMNIDRIEREIKLYSGSDAFQETLARAASRIANREADLFVVKQKKGLL
jgi:hypothetical protein